MKSLNNPIATAAITSIAISKSTQNVLKWTFIGGVIVVTGMVALYIYKHRFVKMLQNRNYDRPNISASEARLKADNLYNAMVGFGANYDKVKAQLLGVNYNRFVLIYNALGKRESSLQKLNPLNFGIVSKGMTLTEWLLDQFKSSNRLADLRALLPGNFI